MLPVQSEFGIGQVSNRFVTACFLFVGSALPLSVGSILLNDFTLERGAGRCFSDGAPDACEVRLEKIPVHAQPGAE